MTKLLVDGDHLAFQFCSAVEVPIEWEPDVWTLHANADDAKRYIIGAIQNAKKATGASDVIVCLSDKENFRKSLDASYKANRSGVRKPVCYTGILEWFKEEFEFNQVSGLEADDVQGILHTSGMETIIAAVDKDLRTIPGAQFNPAKPELGIFEITPEEAKRFHFYQTLVGDSADNYKGCPGCGPVKAEKILAEDCSWDSIVKTYEKAGLTENDALLQARLSKILTWDLYDRENKKPIMWMP